MKNMHAAMIVAFKQRMARQIVSGKVGFNRKDKNKNNKKYARNIIFILSSVYYSVDHVKKLEFAELLALMTGPNRLVIIPSFMLDLKTEKWLNYLIFKQSILCG